MELRRQTNFFGSRLALSGVPMRSPTFRSQPLAYCERDTLAMFELHRALMRLVMKMQE
jgi:hypothetical protein